MTNTMKDLRREVQALLHETLDGREVDMMRGVKPRIPHMLGITDMDAIHTHEDSEGTILDPASAFWGEYEETVDTSNKVQEKVELAIRSLTQDGVFTMTYPYGEEADIVYCEVDEPTVEESDTDVVLQSSCPECGTDLDPSPSLDLRTRSALIKVSVDCPECEFNARYETSMYRA